ncbi:MAG TPA: GAP family protein [Acidimicrobiia bacterium]
MVLNALGEVLGEAVGILVSPLPVVAVILMLFTARGKVNSLAFLVGWVAGLAVVGAIVLSVSDAADVSTDSDASDGSGVVLVVVGVLLILAAIRRWRQRPRPGEVATPPRWMSRIDGLRPVAALLLGILLSALNPKNLLLAVAAAVTIGQAGLSTGDEVVTWAIFVLVASLSILAPVLYRVIRGERAQATLDGARSWLEANNAVVMAVVFLVIGAKVLGNGLSTLS